MWRIWAISMWRLEKYLAKIAIKINLIKSAGSKETSPNLNQLCAPLVEGAIRKRRIKKIADITKSPTKISVRRRNLQSKKLNTKKHMNKIPIHNTCLSNKKLWPTKEFIVTSPAPRIGTIAETRTQSRAKKLLRTPSV